MSTGLSLDLEAFDRAMIDRAVPPGSIRYFSLLYSPAEKRDVLTALYVVDTQIRESARGASHDVAHTRLMWWRAEIDRLINASPQHPAARSLLPLRDLPGVNLANLHELVVAADMDLARMTFATTKELTAYTERSGGILLEMAARWLAAPGALALESVAGMRRLGAAIRTVEIIRDVRQDAIDGRVYLPLELLDARGVTIEMLRGIAVPDNYRALLQEIAATIQATLDTAKHAVQPSEREALRPLLVSVQLHGRLLRRIAQTKFDVASQRVELGAFEKVWGAWRAARCIF